MADPLDIQFTDESPTPLDINFEDQPQERHWIGKTADVVKKWGWLAGPAGPAISGLSWILTRKTEQPDQQREAHGILDAAVAGYQSSASTMLATGRLPDVVLDPHHAKWYERLASTAAQIGADFSLMGLSAAGAGLVASESGPGAAIAGGAAAFAVPAAIRTALTQAYSRGDVTSLADFLDRTAITMRATNEAAITGGLTGAVGAYAAPATSAMADKFIAQGMAEPIAQRLARIPGLGAETATMTVVPALLEKRLPEPQEFIDAALLIGGLHGAQQVAGKLLTTYAKTGVRPVEAVADAKVDPTIAEDLAKFGDSVRIDRSFVDNGETNHVFKISDGDGNDVGSGIVAVSPKDIRIYNVGIDQGARGNGLGLAAYRYWVDRALSEGKVFRSDVEVSKDAQNIYAALERRGYTVERNPKAVVDEDGRLIVEKAARASSAGAVFTVTGSSGIHDVSSAGYEVPRAYQPLAAEMAAAEAFPGTKAQAVLDHPFADTPETKQPHQMNLKYIEGPEDLKALQTRMADVYREEIDAARGGTQGWAETEAKAARQVADMTGRDLAKVMAGRQPGDTANAVQLKIQGDILMQATVEAGAAIKAVKDAGLDATDAMRADALEAIHKAAMVQADITGASAELGRALQYLQRIKELRAQGEGIAKLVDMYGGDPQKLLDMASAIDTPEGLAKFARGVSKATTWEKVIEAWKAGLVSGPITQTANVMGNVSFAALRPAVDAVAAAFSLGGANADRVRPVEPLARIIGDIEGVRSGLRAAREAFFEDSPGGKAEHQRAIQGKTGYAIRTPFRLLSAGDALFRVMIEHGEAYALAARQAAKEGLNPATREFRERVAEIAQNPTEAMIDQIEHAGTRFTFNAPLGEKGRAVQQFVRSWHLQWAVPFISTPGNVFKEMARLTPAASLVGEWRADFEAGGPRRAKALAEVALGTGVSALTMAAALAGHITGSGDPDPNKRRVQMASGWQPYSVKIGNTWYSYQRLQPVGTLLGLAADVAEVWEHMTPDESDKVPKILATAFANAVTKQTFLQGMSQVVDALSDPDRKGARFAQNVLASTIPAAVGQTAQIVDPYQREIQSILDAVKARIPGVRESLMPKRDPFGEPIASQERVAGITPLATTDISGDRVRTEAARLAALPGGLSVAPAPKSINLPSDGTGLGTVDLTPEQRDIFAETSGKLAYQALSLIVNSPAWNYMSDFERVMVYREVFSAMNQMGKAAALTEEQRQTKVHEILQGVAEKLKPATLSPE